MELYLEVLLFGVQKLPIMNCNFTGWTNNKVDSTLSDEREMEKDLDFDLRTNPVKSTGDSSAGRRSSSDSVSSSDDSSSEEEYISVDDSKKSGLYLVKEEDECYRVLRWKVEEFTKVYNAKESKVYSDWFEVGGSKWRILMFPRGNGANCLSLYIELDTKKMSTSDTGSAKFQLGVVNRRDYRKSFNMEASKEFSTYEKDWGFRRHMTHSVVLNRSEGFLDDDTLTIEVTLDHKSSTTSTTSKISDGDIAFVGLQNQGATCYLNSLLQTLFHLTDFRRVVYSMPTENLDDPEKSIPLALQRVFYNLQFGADSSGTKQLTKSFGWDTVDSFMQHDVQELARVLLDNLETKMKGTDAESNMKRLFQGIVKNFVRCLNVDYESTREEPFYDLQLDVKGCSTLVDSFKKYVETEKLDGENKYDAGTHGMQDAEKGMGFLHFPDVLMLHLKRFNYDFQTDRMYKINDWLEFPLELDLTRFLDKSVSNENEGSNVFGLFSVLVHSGDVHGGHYYAFVKEWNTSAWYKFDDDRVSRVDESEAVTENFGRVEVQQSKRALGGLAVARRFQQLTSKRFSNAYMLVYVRKSVANQVLKPIEEEHIARYLRNKFQEEMKEEERLRKEREDAHLYANIRVAFKEDLEKHDGCDLIKFATIKPLRIWKSATFLELKERIEKEYGCPVGEQRLWTWTSRQNKTYRVDECVPSSYDKKTLESFFRYSPYQSEKTNLFCEVSKKLKPLERNDMLFFFKYYNPKEEKVVFINHLVVEKSDTIAKLSPIILSWMEWPEKTSLLVFEEIRSSRTDEVRNNARFAEAELMTGDILIFQKKSDLDLDIPFPTSKEFLSYRTDRIVISLYKLEDEDRKSAPVSVELRKSMKYDDVSEKVAKALFNELKEKIDKESLRLTGHSSYSEAPRRDPMKSTTSWTLVEMVKFGNTISPILYYEILPIPLAEMEKMVEVKAQFMDVETLEDTLVEFLVPLEANVADMFELVREKFDLDAETKLRLVEVYGNKIQKEFELTDLVRNFYYSYTLCLRVEKISQEELEATEEDMVVPVIHGERDYSIHRCHGVPFFTVVHPTTTTLDVKRIVQKKLKSSDEEVEKWKVYGSQYNANVGPLGDDANVMQALIKAAKFPDKTASILIERKDTGPKLSTTKSSWSRYGDKDIKIYN